MIGTVLIYRSSGLLPWLIRKFTKSNWNHAAIIGEETEYGFIVYEAQAQGFIKTEYTFEYLSRRLNNGTIIGLKSKIPLKNVKQNCEKYLDIPYGVWTLIQIAYSVIFKKYPYTDDNTKHLICSEAVARVLYDSSNKKLNFEKEFDKPFDYVTPEDLFNSKYLK